MLGDYELIRWGNEWMLWCRCDDVIPLEEVVGGHCVNCHIIGDPTPENVEEPTLTRWMVTWDEDDGVEYQSGPYERRQNAEQQFHHRHTDPLARNIEMWELEKVAPENVETP